MMTLNVSTQNNFPTLSGIPIFYHIKDLNGKFSPRHRITSSRFHRNAFPIYVSISNSRSFQTWAHFGRPTKRRNSLRKKLLKDKQVRLNENLTDSKSDTQNSPSRYSDIGSLEENSNNNGMEEIEAAKGVSDHNGVENVRVEKEKSKLLVESVLMDELENWVDQYKKDVEKWGIGSYPIFTVYQDSSGNVKRVSVDEGEILRRGQVQAEEIEDFPEVNHKILSAKRLAREMENDNNVIPKNSSVAKFVVQGKETGFVNTIRGFASQQDLLPKLSGVGGRVLCVFVFMWAVKELFAFKNKETQYTEMEKEMMRRKIKSRKEKEVLKGTVDVIAEASEPPMLHIEKPKLDKEKLKNSIMKAKASVDKAVPENSSFKATAASTDMTPKIQEIRDMARKAREIEGKIHSSGSSGREMDDFVIGETSNEVEGVHKLSGEDTSSSKHQDDVVGKTVDIDATLQTPCTEVTEIMDNSFPYEEVLTDGFNLEASNVTHSNDKKCNKQGTELSQCTVQPKNEEVSQLPDTTVDDSCMTKESLTNDKPLVIRSVSEAKAYLSKKLDKQEVGTEPRMQMINDNMDDLRSPTGIDSRSQESQLFEMNTAVPRNSALVGISDLKPSINAGEDSDQKKDKEFGILKNDHIKETEVEHEVGDPQNFETSLDHEVNCVNTETNLSAKTENWLEKNFDEVEPIIKKIRAGFRDSYVAAKERADQPLDITTEMEPLEDGGEFDWMQNERLRDIVFKVRDNELAGHDPFYLIDDKDKEAFFRGLEKKVEKENKKLSYLHEWLHSNIENLDYGADGISLYDPREKIIPRWKGPPVEKIPDFLNDFLEQRKKSSTSKMEAMKNDENGFAKKSAAVPSHKDYVATRDSMKIHNKNQINPKIVVEGSDGSVKAGKKSGKEYWQHTKKWSQGFLESYNAETDPEVKSVMKDIGKDLDRWITEKEIEEAAEVMNRIPDRNKSVLEKKLNKVKREMELFGPQAVVSKYREYADEEEDYLWWLDLPYVLCIELYTIDDGEQRVGFYSLEMAKDLEVEPKPHHVIAFQDAGDCKSLCYIIQAHMDMLGNGQAFVVAQHPKDAFREAKANAFGVTVIKKGELKLNIDQPLEEVEELIAEIGSKMYHDMIMKEQSMDINSLMKGVFGFSDRSIKRLKRKMKKPSK
ncbi:hypothetical protein K1719_018892 [Acacia pycnantha]|nr:hypothetical protein K1719_018892 [Acacia pycnantha]